MTSMPGAHEVPSSSEGPCAEHAQHDRHERYGDAQNVHNVTAVVFEPRRAGSPAALFSRARNGEG
jgi:hypothetical protein